MDHKELKKLLLSDIESKYEYNELEPIYSDTHEFIKLRLEKGLTTKAFAEIVGTK